MAALRLARLVAYLALGSYALLVVHDFYGYSGAYPYLAGDEALGNVSYTLATQGRYGDLVIPLQPIIHVPRHNGMFNYGPWYFYLGAGLIWLFGYSVVLLRSIHLWVIVFTAFAAVLWFRRDAGRIAGAAFALAILHAFDTTQWPMIRPDSIVSFFAVLFVVSAGMAMRTQRSRWWFAAGLAASCAAFSHLIAWTIVLACIVVFAADQVRRRRERPSAARGTRGLLAGLGCLAGGGLAGAAMFYGSFGFRVADHLEMLSIFDELVVSRTQAAIGSSSYRSVLAVHLDSAFAYLPLPARGALVLAWIAGWALVFTTRRGADGSDRPRLLPPLLAWTLYAASLGAYPNFHAGYAIVHQVLAFWTAAAVLDAILALMRGRAAMTAGALASVLLAGAAGRFAGSKIEAAGYRTEMARRWVDIEDHIDRILDPLPRGARVWGTTMYGIETPERVQLVRFADAAMITGLSAEADRPSRAPEYVVWGCLENGATVPVMRGEYARYELGVLSDLFPTFRYDLVSLTAAEPYRVTRVYERRSREDPPPVSPPAVSVYDPASRQWESGLGSAQPVRFTSSAPAHFSLSYRGRTWERDAALSLVSSLPAGNYALRVRLRPGRAPSAERMLAVTSALQVQEGLSELGPTFDVAAYRPADQESWLVHRHPGGALYVSLVDEDRSSSIETVEVYPVSALPDLRRESLLHALQPLPPPSAWSPDSAGGVTATACSDGRRTCVSGNASALGYQLVSPAIPVSSGSRLFVRFPVDVERGHVCTGVLGEGGRSWIVPPDTAAAEHVFALGAQRSITLVVANCNIGSTPAEPSRFAVTPGGFTRVEDKLYVDLLVEKPRYPRVLPPAGAR